MRRRYAHDLGGGNYVVDRGERDVGLILHEGFLVAEHSGGERGVGPFLPDFTRVRFMIVIGHASKVMFVTGEGGVHHTLIDFRGEDL